jgi:choline dehydrogenase-like flavoprotein
MSDPLAADVVFVGSGIAAAIAGAALAKKGAKVLFLEAGPRVVRGEAVRLFQSSPGKGQNSPYPTQAYAPQPEESDLAAYYVQQGPEKFRGQQARVVGGTTWHWGGLAMRFRPNDFALKSKFGVGVDWPIVYGDLEYWYDIAEHEMGVAGDAGEDWGSPRKSEYPMPPIPMSYCDRQVGSVSGPLGYTMAAFPQARNSVWRDGRPQCCGNATCVPICPIQAKYDATVHLSKAERVGARTIPEAVVHRLVVGDDGRISQVNFLRPDRSEGSATGRFVAVAAHAIETPKLLLMSASERAPNGVANGSDQVGRNLMSQIDVGIQGLARDPVYAYRGPVSTGGIREMRDGDFRGTHAALGLSPTNEGWERAVGPLTAAARFIKQGLRGNELKRAIRDHVSRQVLIGTSTEMLPDPANRVSLATAQKDVLGLPHPAIYFQYDEYVTRAHAVARNIQDAIMAGLGATEVEQLGPICDSAIMGGTARMGDSPRTSVVDKNLMSYDHSNLYIVGSAVFPTITATAPTLTIGALSARLGAHLLDRLAS